MPTFVFWILMMVLFALFFFCGEHLLLSRGNDSTKRQSKWTSTKAWIIYLIILVILTVALFICKKVLG
ncbi:hypothetical protein SAMN02910369_00405 [Lachnospiraceae bacterium NE2001]|nr:hypothetical protein SAMN02910369_00405 [Lachnospiraceae bacterium NE2001]